MSAYGYVLDDEIEMINEKLNETGKAPLTEAHLETATRVVRPLWRTELSNLELLDNSLPELEDDTMVCTQDARVPEWWAHDMRHSIDEYTPPCFFPGPYIAQWFNPRYVCQTCKGPLVAPGHGNVRADLVTDHDAVKKAKDPGAISVVPRHQECSSVFPMGPFDDDQEQDRTDFFNTFVAEFESKSQFGDDQYK